MLWKDIAFKNEWVNLWKKSFMRSISVLHTPIVLETKQYWMPSLIFVGKAEVFDNLRHFQTSLVFVGKTSSQQGFGEASFQSSLMFASWSSFSEQC